MEIIINEGTLSDLFFNYEHPNLDRVTAESADDGGLDMDEYAAALLPDAVEFAAMLDNQVTADWLVSNFIKRV